MPIASVFLERDYFHRQAARFNFAESVGQKCDALGCHSVPSRFVGGDGCWLRFCSKHKESAIGLNQYFLTHANARPRRYGVKVSVSRKAVAENLKRTWPAKS